VKTLALVVVFGAIGFFVGLFFANHVLESSGPFMAFLAMPVIVPLATVVGVLVGFSVAQWLQR
jgi:hypothetical protein